MSQPPLVTDLLDLAIAGSTALVVHRVAGLLNEGWAPDDIVTEVLAPMQVETGRRWEVGALTVAEEHAVTAIVDSALETVSVLAPAPRTTRGRMAVVCAQGEWHVLAARMAAQRWRWMGWEVVFLGGSLPPADLGRWLEVSRPDVLACSCSMAEHLPGLVGIDESAAAVDVPLVAGGAGIGSDGTPCRMLGIRWAEDVAGLEDAMRQAAPQPDAAELFGRRAEADDLLSEIDEVVTAAMYVVLGEVPALAEAHQLRRQQVVGDLRVVVRNLVATVLAGDPRVFTDFLAWRRRVLSARGVAADLQHGILTALAAVLYDFDLAAGYLAMATVDGGAG